MSQLKLENNDLKKSLDNLKGKQPLFNKFGSEGKSQKSFTQRLINGLNSKNELTSEEGSSSDGGEKRSRSNDKK